MCLASDSEKHVFLNVKRPKSLFEFNEKLSAATHFAGNSPVSDVMKIPAAGLELCTVRHNVVANVVGMFYCFLLRARKNAVSEYAPMFLLI
jgi:hypothetical protein